MAASDIESDTKITIVPREDGNADLLVKVSNTSIWMEYREDDTEPSSIPEHDLRDLHKWFNNMGLLLANVPDLEPLIEHYTDAVKATTCWICGGKSYTYIGTFDVHRNFGIKSISGQVEVHQVECDGCGSAYTVTSNNDPMLLLDCVQNKREMP
jgi:hypothetical protein